jgi:hypothetical protein
MKRGVLMLAALALLFLGLGQARAGFIPLPTQLDSFVNPDGSSNGNFTTVQAPNELDTFSNFSYSTDPVGSPPLARDITVNPFLPPPPSNEGGLQFKGAFAALAGMTVDYALSYVVTAPPGSLITDAVLSAAMNNNGGTGTVSIVELLTFPDGTGASMEVSLPGNSDASLTFPGVQSILVQKDIFINGGSLGANVSSIDQGFSSGNPVPEPVSVTLAMIGACTAGLAGWRQRRKQALA